MRVYYNEIDPFAAAWLRELMKAKQIPDGEVDERSIIDVRADDLRGFGQCHFFAGIGGWAYALRLAGWPDDREAWTGSCPCQPFSSAGAQAGGHDPRDLWPAWRVLIAECRPQCVFGEQVEAAIGHGWLDRVCDDLEREGYAIGACGLPAASVGAFHIRQRLWFVAESDGRHTINGDVQRSWQHRLRAEDRRVDGHTGNTERSEGNVADTDRRRLEQRDTAERTISEPHARCAECEEFEVCAHMLGYCANWWIDELQRRAVADASRERRQQDARSPLADTDSVISSDGRLQRSGRLVQPSEDASIGSRMADAEGDRASGNIRGGGGASTSPETADEEWRAEVGTTSRPFIDRNVGNFWSRVDWIPCADGKARPVEPGTFPLVTRLSGELVPSGDPSESYAQACTEARVGRLRGYGNAIVPQVAAELIAAYMEIR